MQRGSVRAPIAQHTVSGLLAFNALEGDGCRTWTLMAFRFDFNGHFKVVNW